MAVVWLGLAMMLALSACAPSGGSGSPAAVKNAGSAVSAPQRTLVIAYRAELPSLAAKPLVSFSAALNPALFLFNAALDIADERGTAQPQLAEALPRLNTDTWRVFPDGRMETSYRLKPNLTWHDGTPLSAEDFVFAWRIFAKPELGNSTSPPINLMEEVVAPDPGTVLIRWREPFADAA